LGHYGSTSFSEADRYRSESYEKSAKCLNCKYLYVCDGVEKTKDHCLLKYIKPCNGILLKSIDEFICSSTEKFY
jgi:radical SAM protein with 4Fe4S-binding SPASM domain